jgi:hypothetical protein
MITHLGWNGEEPLLVDNHVHVAAQDILQLHGYVHVDAAIHRLIREQQVGECLLRYAHKTRQVSKRPVSKRLKTSCLQNVRFKKMSGFKTSGLQNVQFLNLLYLLNKKYRNCQVCIPI